MFRSPDFRVCWHHDVPIVKRHTVRDIHQVLLWIGLGLRSYVEFDHVVQFHLLPHKYRCQRSQEDSLKFLVVVWEVDNYLY